MASGGRSRTSGVWEYYHRDTPVKGRATCRLCPPPGRIMVMNGSTTSNLWAHVKIKHGCDLHPAATSRGKVSEKSPNIPNVGSQASVYSKKPSDFVRKTACPESRTRTITDLIANWFASDARPVSIVDDKGFKDLVAYMEPRYSMPSRTDLTTILKGKYELALAKVRELLSSDDATALSFTTDVWTSATDDVYLTLCAHFVAADFSSMSCCLGTDTLQDCQTSANITVKVRSMLDTFCVPTKRQVAVVYDQADNRGLALHDWEQTNPTLVRVICACRRLENIVKAGLTVPGVSKLLASVRKIVTHFKQSVTGMDAIYQRQAGQNERKLKFVQDVPAQWSSTLCMMERLLILRPHVTAVLNDSAITKKKDAQRLDLQAEQYDIMESLITILKRFEVATTILSAEKTVTISCVLHVVVELEATLEAGDSHSSTVAEVKNTMLQDLQKRFSLKPFDGKTIEAMASILDPRFHHVLTLGRLSYGEIVAAVKKQLRRMFSEEGLGTRPQSDLPEEPSAKRRPTALELMLTHKLSMDKMNKSAVDMCTYSSQRTVEEELEDFLLEDEIGINSNPLYWWRSHSKTYPRVWQLARSWLAIPASSPSSRRMCSLHADTTQQRRCSLTAQDVNMIVFLNNNLCLLTPEAKSSTTTTTTTAPVHVKMEVGEDSPADGKTVGDAAEVESDDDCLPLPQLYRVAHPY